MFRNCSKGLFMLLVLAVSGIFCNTTYAGQTGSYEYSADMVSRTGRETIKAKLYVSEDKMRTEMAGNIIITRFDKNLSWVIMPSEKMYMEQSINRKMLPKTSREFEGELERVSLGMENVDGKPAEKFKVTYKEGSARVSVYQWLRDFKFPVKVEAVDGSWSMEYKNLSVKPQQASLFEGPQGFQKLSMPFAAGFPGSRR